MAEQKDVLRFFQALAMRRNATQRKEITGRSLSKITEAANADPSVVTDWENEVTAHLLVLLRTTSHTYNVRYGVRTIGHHHWRNLLERLSKTVKD